MPSIIQRLRRKLKARSRHDQQLSESKDNKQQPLATLPVLPESQSLILNIPQQTAPASHLNDHFSSLQAALPANQQTQSRFFTLPLEIRLEIYELLFGKRTVHIALTYGPGLGYGQTDISSSSPVPQKRWTWWHATCHAPQMGHDQPGFGAFAYDLCYDVEDGYRRDVREGREYTSPDDDVTAEEYFRQTKLAGLAWLRTCQIGYV